MKLKPKMKSEVMAEAEFKTLNVCVFDSDNVRTFVAYQSDEHGRGRLALVNADGSVLAHGFPGIYQHPIFATFGTQIFVALTKFFDGEPCQTETVYRLEEGSRDLLLSIVAKDYDEDNQEER